MSAETLLPCPFCCTPLTLGGGVNPYGRCETPGCWMHERKISLSLDAPAQVEQWNRRTPQPDALPGDPREALRLAQEGADKAGCDGWRAQEKCRQIARILSLIQSERGDG